MRSTDLRVARRTPMIAALTALFGAIPASAFALSGPSPGAASAQTVKLPSGPGSVRGLADNATVSGFTGQVQYAVPVELPGGPGGLAPSLALGYDGDLGNGPLGVGWALSQPGIRRSLRLGVPTYDARDELDIVGLAGGGQLVALADGSYRAEGQGNSFTGRPVDGGFELTGPDGKVYRFGTSDAGRKASGTRVAAWYLEQIKDVAGQTVDYHYHQDRGEVYLDAITWGPLVTGAPAFRAELIYQSRGDAVVGYRTGFRVESAQRLAQIRIWSFGAVQRVMSLGYDETFALSRLSSVQLTSADGHDAMPPLGFSYAAATTGAVTQIPDLAGWALNQQGTSLFDVDGDGAMDLLRLQPSGHSYRRNLGGQFDVARPVAGAAGASLDQVRLLDLTGDSGAELVWQQGSQWSVFQLTGTDPQQRSWTSLGSWSGAQNVSLGTVTVADVNGDYLMDVLSVSGSSMQVRMGTVTGLAAPVLRSAIDPARPFIAPGNAATSFPDINGDGLADVVYLSSSAMFLYLGRGDGSFEHYRDLPYPWTGSVTTAQIRLGDLNRDGLLDVVVVRAGNVEWYRGLANGTVTPTPVQLTRPAGTDASVVVALADANGNGSEDIVWSSDAGMWILDLAGPTSAGMLIAIDNGLGQTQSLRYDASTQLALGAAAAGTPWTTTMPVSIPVTSSNRLTLASGEPPRSTRLDVRDGIYDRTERRFIGFGESTVTRPDPADGAPPAQIMRQVQRFAPGLGLDREQRGKVIYERIEDGTGTVLQETTYDVATIAIAGLPTDEPRLRHGVIRATEVQHREGLPSPLTSHREYRYDDEGREIEDRDLGRLDLAGDESIVRRSYTQGRSARGVRDRVSEEWLIALDASQTETVVTHTQVLFGDEASVAPLGDAGAGWERSRSQYLDGGARWVELGRSDYDALGNVIHLVAGGVARTIEYDAYGLHPVAEQLTPQPGRVLRWQATWDNVLGLPTSVVDAAGVLNVVAYDGLGRLRSATQQGAAPHVIYQYHWQAPRPYVETLTYDGSPASVPALPATWTPGSGWRDAIAVSNSAGQPLFTATRLDVDRWIVAGSVDRDALGRTVVVSDPFEWTGAPAGVVTAVRPTDTPVRTVTYDGLDRMVRQTLPTGASTVYSYSPFSTTIITDGFAPVTIQTDGRGKVRHTERVVNGIRESLDAIYDAAGRITATRLQGGADQHEPLVEHRFTYDSLGRLVFATDPDIGDLHMSYDDAGQLTARSNALGQTITYSYDGAGRLAAMQGDGAQFAYHYDDALDATSFANTAGRLAWIDEPSGRVELGYDRFGHLAHRRRSVHGEVADELTGYGAAGLPLSVDHGDGVAFDIAYDPAGRAIRIGDLWTVEAQDASGAVLRERFGNGTVETYERGVLGLATRVQFARPTGTLVDVHVDRDGHGNITAVTDSDGTGLDHTATFSYDGGARLIASTLGTGAAQYRFRYAYDGLQNMLRREAVGPAALGALVGDYRYGETVDGRAHGPRQLTSVAPDPAAGSPAGATATTFDYDAAGRMVRDGGLALGYNALDQLIHVTGLPGGAAVEHGYGYDGQRVYTLAGGKEQRLFSPAVAENGDGVRTYDVRLGDRLVARLVSHPAAPAGVVARGAAVTHGLRVAVLGSGLVLVMFALAIPRRGRRRHAAAALTVTAVLTASCGTAATTVTRQRVAVASERLFYHLVIGAGPSVVTRADGSVLEERRYEPFGQTVDAVRELPTGTQHGPVDYAVDPHNILNQLSDPSTGWSDHGARWLAPEIGRWLVPDPPGKAPDDKYLADPWSMHPYQYVHQNPVMLWDPDGHDDRCNCTHHQTTGKLPGEGAPVPASSTFATATSWQDISPSDQEAWESVTEHSLGLAGAVEPVGMASFVRIWIPNTNGLYLELDARGYIPRGGSTSTVFIQSTDGKTHLRLDYGYNKTTGTVDYHWNQKGTYKTFGITDHTSVGAGGELLYKSARVFKWAGRGLFVVGAVADLISIVQAKDKVRQTIVVASGLAGAWAGLKLGGAGGGELGTFIEPGGGSAVGGFLGGIAGSVAGFFGARWAAGKVYDEIVTEYTPLPEDKQ